MHVELKLEHSRHKLTLKTSTVGLAKDKLGAFPFVGIAGIFLPKGDNACYPSYVCPHVELELCPAGEDTPLIRPLGFVPEVSGTDTVTACSNAVGIFGMHQHFKLS